jgi:hypothetical protein
MGVTEYEPRVVQQLLEYGYRVLSACLLQSEHLN